MGASLYNLCVPTSFDGRAGSEVSKGCILELVAISLVEVRLDLEGLKPEPGVSWDFSYVQWQSSPNGGMFEASGLKQGS